MCLLFDESVVGVFVVVSLRKWFVPVSGLGQARACLQTKVEQWNRATN